MTTPASPLSAYEKIVIDAPASTVWARIRNFDALQDWLPPIAQSPADKGNTPGSVRKLKVRGGGEADETLVSHDEARMQYSYTAADGGALPVTGYMSTIQVIPQGQQALVEWRGEFFRADRGNSPATDKNDETALNTITSIYQGGLLALKKLIEG